MSLNSSAAEPEFRALGAVGTLVEESFAALQRELPEAHLRIREHLADLSLRVEIDDERFGLAFSAAQVQVTAQHGVAAARVRTGRAGISALLDGDVSLADAVREDRLQVVAPLEVLARLQEGLRLYVHGAVRCPAFPGFLERFRALSARAEDLASEGDER